MKKEWIKPVGCLSYHLFIEEEFDGIAKLKQVCGGSLYIDDRAKRDPNSEVSPQFCEKCTKINSERA